MTKPEELRYWAVAIANDWPRGQPSPGEVEHALRDYAELLEDMQTLARILNKWGP